MRPLPLAAFLVGLALATGFAMAADLDRRHVPRHRLPPPPDDDEPPAPRIYTRPVVGFYGYPFDYAVPPPLPYARGTPPAREPYIIKNDEPHAVEVR